MNEYDEYAEGYEVGEEAAQEPDCADRVQSQAEHDDAKSNIWWKGFQDGRNGTWDPPAVEEVQHKE
jgi:hypothetical protein